MTFKERRSIAVRRYTDKNKDLIKLREKLYRTRNRELLNQRRMLWSQKESNKQIIRETYKKQKEYTEGKEINKRQVYTMREDELILSGVYENRRITYKEMADMLGRSVAALRTQRSILKQAYDREYS